MQIVGAALELVEREPYKPVLTARERRAYQAAYAIMQLTEHGEHELVCPGGRRSRQLDRIAAIILEAAQ